MALGCAGNIGIGVEADWICKVLGGKTCSNDYSLGEAVEEDRVEREAWGEWVAIALGRARVGSASALAVAIPLPTWPGSPAIR